MKAKAAGYTLSDLMNLLPQFEPCWHDDPVKMAEYDELVDRLTVPARQVRGDPLNYRRMERHQRNLKDVSALGGQGRLLYLDVALFTRSLEGATFENILHGSLAQHVTILRHLLQQPDDDS